MKKSITKQNEPTSLSNANELENFLTTAKSIDPKNRGRLIFSLDATASRQATWDQASQLQGDMFTKTRGIGALDLQLVYYRGYGECKASGWLNNTASLLKLMNSVTCLAGATQIERLLRHALAEAKKQPVSAMVFVGDCVEEDLDRLGNLAGQLKLLGLPLFIFQEGYDATAKNAFAQLATLSGGAHCQFDAQSAQQLGDLLNAVAIYAAGGKMALKSLSGSGSKSATLLLQQLK